MGLSPLRKRVLVSRVLSRTFGLKGDVVTGGWRQLHNEKLQSHHTLLRWRNQGG